MSIRIILFSLTLSITVHALFLGSGWFTEEDKLKSQFSTKKSGFNVSIREVKKKRKKIKRKNTPVKPVNKKTVRTNETEDFATTPSRILHRPVPRYPYKSREFHEEGIVLVKVKVDESGKALDAFVVKSSDYARLDGAALEAAMKGVYSASVENGVRKSAEHELEFKFELND
jgi:protein TonB